MFLKLCKDSKAIGACGFAKMAAKARSKFFKDVFGAVFSWTFSMHSIVAFLCVPEVDDGGLYSVCVHGGILLECAL